MNKSLVQSADCVDARSMIDSLKKAFDCLSPNPHAIGSIEHFKHEREQFAHVKDVLPKTVRYMCAEQERRLLQRLKQIVPS